jgi:hypothetical protein
MRWLGLTLELQCNGCRFRPLAIRRGAHPFGHYELARLRAPLQPRRFVHDLADRSEARYFRGDLAGEAMTTCQSSHATHEIDHSEGR